MSRFPVVCLAALLAFAVLPTSSASSSPDRDPMPFEFSRIARTLENPPELNTSKPRYAMFLFGLRGQVRVWAILDQKDPTGERFDILHLDLDGNGEFDAKERFECAEPTDERCVFTIGDFVDPADRVQHTEFKLTWTPESIRYSMKWFGEKVTKGSYGPYRETYAKFAASPKDAPILVPGWGRPFEFELWMCDKLTPGQSVDFKVFVGSRGSVRGAFSAVDDRFLPKGHGVRATLIYRDGRGKEQRVQAILENRC